jgi:hypothetical protein
MIDNNIQVNIGGRIYTPTVKKDEVDRVVKAAGLINDRMNVFEKTYAVKDKQDLLAMCCLQFATQYLETDNLNLLHSDGVSEKITALEKVISDHLNKEK